MAVDLRTTTSTAGDDEAEAIAAEVQDLVTQLQTDYAKRDKLYKDIDDVLFQQLPVRVPEAYKDIADVRRSSIAVEFTSTITSAWTINAPSTEFRPVAFGDKAIENSTLREHFFDASWKRQVAEAGGNVFRRYAHAVAAKGEGVLKTTTRQSSAWAAYTKDGLALVDRMTDGDLKGLDTDAKDRLWRMSAEEAKRAAPYPILTVDVPPEQYYCWQTDGVGTTLAVEVKQVPYLETLLKYGAGLDGRGRVVMGESRPGGAAATEWGRVMSGTPTLTMIEVWRKNVCYYVLLGPGQLSSGTGMGRGTVVKTIRHGYADPTTGALRGPYFRTLGSVTSSREPGRSGLGVLFGYLSLFPMLDSLRTMQFAAAVMTGFPAFRRVTPPNTGLPAPFGDDGLPAAKAAEPIKPGFVYPYDIQPIEQPEAAPVLRETMMDIREELQGILPPVLQGVTAQSDSGYEYNQAVYLARTKWSAPIQNIEQTLADRVGFESWLIENRIGETVYAWGEPPKSATNRKSGGDQGWLGIGPDDLNGVHTYGVHLNPETPSNEVIKVRTHKEMVDAEFEDIDDARTDLGKNPDEVERAILARKVKQLPQVQDFLIRRMLQKLGQGEAIAQAAAQQATQQMDGGAGGFAAGAPDVFQPGQNGVPIAPTAPGPSAAPGGGAGVPANPTGSPAGTPQQNIALPGAGPTAV